MSAAKRTSSKRSFSFGETNEWKPNRQNEIAQRAPQHLCNGSHCSLHRPSNDPSLQWSWWPGWWVERQHQWCMQCLLQADNLLKTAVHQGPVAPTHLSCIQHGEYLIWSSSDLGCTAIHLSLCKQLLDGSCVKVVLQKKRSTFLLKLGDHFWTATFRASTSHCPRKEVETHFIWITNEILNVEMGAGSAEQASGSFREKIYLRACND